MNFFSTSYFVPLTIDSGYVAIESDAPNRIYAQYRNKPKAVVYHNSLASGRTTAKIRYRGRLTSNRYLYVTVAGGNAQMTTTSDTTFL